ncbi:hypothetical protein SAMN03159343_0521 [Klenkia marina]|uniref:Polymerase nucleotidyl transferase domain-containing protein n=1 Tax=Klenkia marina TaxID=1960309 RepID=A0A1G4XC59_9ACTN|nr:nucleotidyltransferase domain-containing protein [Klenkia marina]SCX38853.1 hypothetical protein SAMN03159343_0521 [Klenkia marina]
MRLQRGVLVGGVDPELARDLSRACHTAWTPLEFIARQVRRDVAEVEVALTRLVEAGYLRVIADRDGSGQEFHTSEDTGGGLANASFQKPISRARAQVLLEGVLERTRAYNADDTKPLRISEVAVFGSYTRPDVDQLGDLDLAIVLTPRTEEWLQDSHNPLHYARASGRTFQRFVDQLFWPETEAKMLLRNRSGYISLHTEDPRRFTDSVQVLYRWGDQPDADV